MIMLFNNKKKIVKSFFNICRNNKIYVFFLIKKRIEKKIIKLRFNNKEDYKFDFSKSYSQFLYSRLIHYNKNFNVKLINSLANESTFYFYLPKDWLLEISKCGVKVNFYLSKILWTIYSLNFFFRFYIKTYFVVFFFLFKSNSKKVIYFNESSFYIPKKLEKTFFPDFITFLSKVIKNSVKNILNKYSFAYSYDDHIKNLTILNKLHLLIYLNFLFFKVLFLRLFKKNDLFLFFKELFFFNFFNYKKNLLPEYVFYSNSDLIYKPLWTYIKKNNLENNVYLYFYSDNFIPINTKNKFKDLNNIIGFGLQSWKKYIFWNKNQFLRFKKITNKKIDYLISPYSFIPFEGKNSILKKRKKTLSIFDVHPMNLYGYSVFSDPKNIYTFTYCKKFIDDLVFLQNKYDFNLIIKSKLRNKNFNIFSKKYYEYLQSLKNKKIQILDKDISAMSVIRISDAVVSIPFTSPALLACSLNKKTCYYDPKSIILDRFYRESEIKLISNTRNLDNWIYKNLVK
jgi:polysaccharide biosynthesis PFTS motif protein